MRRSLLPLLLVAAGPLACGGPRTYSVHSDTAPTAIGPYSQAMVHDGVIYASGQIGIDPATSQLVEGGVTAQARQALKNLLAVVEEAGGRKDTILQATVFLTDIADYAAVNHVYSEAFGGHKPARAAMAVKQLPAGALVEIRCIAAVADG